MHTFGSRMHTIGKRTVIYDILVAGEVHFNLLLNGSIAIIRALMVLKKYINL